MSYMDQKKVSAFSTDVHRAECTFVLRQEVAAAMTTRTLRALVREGSAAESLFQSAAAEPLAESVSAKHYSLSTFCCYLSCSADRHISFSPSREDGGGENAEAPVCLLSSKEIPSFSIRLLNPEQQTNAFRTL